MRRAIWRAICSSLQITYTREYPEVRRLGEPVHQRIAQHHRRFGDVPRQPFAMAVVRRACANRRRHLVKIHDESQAAPLVDER